MALKPIQIQRLTKIARSMNNIYHRQLRKPTHSGNRQCNVGRTLTEVLPCSLNVQLAIERYKQLKLNQL